jgi:uncharacterized repeat protein (TIGR04138 family)
MTMQDPSQRFTELLKRDSRYQVDAYMFVFEALNFAQQELDMGEERPSEPLEIEDEDEAAQTGPQKHVSGQELCEAIRRYALLQYGYLAKTVLNSWGIHATGDFGEIVFNLIGIGRMRKTDDDRREDFDDRYDFETAFQEDFKISQAD